VDLRADPPGPPERSDGVAADAGPAVPGLAQDGRQGPEPSGAAGAEAASAQGERAAKLLFQIFTEREERKATAVATNSPFNEWDTIFNEPRLCAAIADRITFRCTLIQTGTESYRFQATEAERHPKNPR
jgi:hypothetical protein